MTNTMLPNPSYRQGGCCFSFNIDGVGFRFALPNLQAKFNYQLSINNYRHPHERELLARD
jgi:hypothetical protein